MCIISYHHLPQKPLVMPPPSFLQTVLTIFCPPCSFCRLTPAAETPPASTIPTIKQDHPWPIYSAHQLVLLTCSPSPPVPVPFSTSTPSQLSRTHDFILTDRHHHKEPFCCLHRHFSQTTKPHVTL